MINHDTLTVVIGPSGAGKSTHIAELLLHTDAQLVRTETDRHRRSSSDDDTHIFITTEEYNRKLATGAYLGHGSMLGYNYGLPHLPKTPQPKIILLRAPFIPEVLRQRPDARVIQFEALVPELVERLESRGDYDRIDPARLELEIAMGRKLTSHIVSTSVPFDESYAQFTRLWDAIQNEQ